MAIGALLPILAAGCASSRSSSAPVDKEAPGSVAWTPLAFLAGPVGPLLTNVEGFSAQVTVETTSITNKTRSCSGVILGHGSTLLFAPSKGDRSFIWDVARGNGYVVSELLQGYAPLGWGLQISTNKDVLREGTTVSERVNGHTCERAEWVSELSDGSQTRFTAWRATDVKGLPVRITAIEGDERFSMDFSSLRLESCSSNLFAPPEEFTKFASVYDMTTELTMRRAMAKSKPKNNSPINANSPMPQLGMKGTPPPGPPQ